MWMQETKMNAEQAAYDEYAKYLKKRKPIEASTGVRS